MPASREYPGRFFLSVAVIVGGIAGCGGEKSSTEITVATEYLPPQFGAAIERFSEPRVFLGPDLYEYIDGGAELYHAYGFVEVATADYRSAGSDFVIDVYRFDSAENAFGLYSMLRPDGATLRSYGIEAFLSSTSIEFVSDRFLFRLTAHAESEDNLLLLNQIARDLDSLCTGIRKYPDEFSRFPEENYVNGTRRLFAESFLGHKFLSGVYTSDFRIKEDTIRLFLLQDRDGIKLRQWRKSLSEANYNHPLADGLPLQNSLVIDDAYQGIIVAGDKDGLLAGAILTNAGQIGFFSSWLGKQD